MTHSLFTQLNLYRVTGILGVLLVGYREVVLSAEYPLAAHWFAGLYAVIVLSALATILASFRWVDPIRNFGAAYLSLSLFNAIFHGLWLQLSGLAEAAVTSSLLTVMFVALVLAERRLIVAWVLGSAVIYGGFALTAPAPVTPVAYVISLFLIFGCSTGAIKAYMLFLQSEQAQSKGIVSAVFEQSSDALLLLSEDGAVVRRANPAAHRMFAGLLDPVQGAAQWQQIKGALETASAGGYAGLIDAVRAGGSWRDRIKLGGAPPLTDPAAVRPLWGDASLVRLAAGEGNSLLLQINDISPLIAHQEELIAANEETRAAMAVQGRFLANMSHEIRTPMNGVIGMTSLLYNTRLDAEQLSYVEIIRSSGEGLLNIINEILDFSKLEAGRVELEQQAFFLEQCVVDSINTVLPMASEKGLELVLDLRSEDCREVSGDVQRLRQVIVNLLSNAVKFTEHGEVLVRVRTSAQGAAEGVSRLDLSIAVEDTGIGIPANKLDALFNAFEQADSSMNRRFGGTGLGLSITRSLIEVMGGKIAVSSTPGSGSQFSFRLPLDDLGRSPELRALEQRARPQLAGQRVVLVADNDSLRRTLAAQLEGLGLSTRSYGTGTELLASAGTLDWELLITDLALPDMDSAALTGALQDRGEVLPPVLLLSSLDTTEADRQRFAATLCKPIRPAELVTGLLLALGYDDAHAAVAQVGFETNLDTLANFAGRTVLIAEDNVVNQKVARQMLSKFGVRSDIVSNGREVIQQQTQGNYALIFMDMQMPEVDGLEATHLLRAMDYQRPPYIIAMTANAHASDQEACLSAGMNDFIAKPVRLEELRAALERASLAGVFEDPGLI